MASLREHVQAESQRWLVLGSEPREWGCVYRRPSTASSEISSETSDTLSVFTPTALSRRSSVSSLASNDQQPAWMPLLIPQPPLAPPETYRAPPPPVTYVERLEDLTGPGTQHDARLAAAGAVPFQSRPGYLYEPTEPEDMPGPDLDAEGIARQWAEIAGRSSNNRSTSYKDVAEQAARVRA